LSHPFADELSFALTISEEVEKLAMSYFNKGIEVVEKSDGSPVTRADKEVERFIRDALATKFPEDAILGEEEGPSDGAAESNGRTWIVDPIDGTYNYARGIPIWSTLLALEVSSEIVLGMIVAPAMHELFYAVKGQGAFKNYLPIKVSNIDRIEKAMINFGGPNRILEHGLWPELTEAVRLTDKQRGFGDYLGFSLVFEGKSEAMLEVGVKPWDIACMKILVEEAGGGFFDLSGGNSVHTGSCMVTNKHLLQDFKKMFVKEKVSK
jgi:histidinol-phosphatase